MKIIKKLLLPCALSVFAALVSACSDSSSQIKSINVRWDLDLPTSMECVYSYDDVGWFGDGVYFYVFDVQDGNLSVKLSVITDEQVEEITSLYSSHGFTEVDGAYYINTDDDLLVHYGSENGGNDFIYLIYDSDLSQLTVMEYHS